MRGGGSLNDDTDIVIITQWLEMFNQVVSTWNLDATIYTDSYKDLGKPDCIFIIMVHGIDVKIV